MWTAGPVSQRRTQTLPPAQLLDFNGNLYFGSIKTIFSGLGGNPIGGGPTNSGIGVTLPLAAHGGALTTKPDHTFGGVTLSAVLLSNGDAVSTYASPLAVAGPTPDSDCLQNICFDRSTITLSTNGVSGFLVMHLPTGFSVGLSPTNRITTANLEYPNTPLDANLHPTNSLTAPGPLYAVEETLPYWFAVPGASRGKSPRARLC